MTSNKRKRSDDVTEKLQVKKEKITSNDEEVVKKPHKEQPLVGGGPSEIFTAAIEKISELEQLINEVGGNEEEEDDDYSSDYSELSDMDSGRFDNDNHVDGDEGVSNGFNPEIVGFAICAQEAMNFLSKEGFSGQNPLVLSMQKRLLDQLTDYQKSLNEPKRRKF